MDHLDLVDMTATIVSAHVSNNATSINDLPRLIGDTFAALSSLGGPAAPPVDEAPTPAVSVRSSVKPDSLTCLVCGVKQKTLKRHLMSAHKLSPDDYRAAYSLPGNYPMTAPNYSQQRAALAKKIGLGTKRDRKGK